MDQSIQQVTMNVQLHEIKATWYIWWEGIIIKPKFLQFVQITNFWRDYASYAVVVEAQYS